MNIRAILHRIIGRHPEPEQPHTGRVCGKCVKVIGRNDKWHLLAAVHDDCSDPRGEHRTEPLDTLLDRGAL